MHSNFRSLAFGLGLTLLGAAQAAAASAKTYQVTGPITEVTPTTITVQKSGDKWEIARDPNTKDDANLKVGDQVTVHYRMVATRIEAKESTGADQPAPKEPARKKK